MEQRSVVAPAEVALAEAIHPLNGAVLDVGRGSGTGVRASRGLGQVAVGVDLSLDQLRGAIDLAGLHVQGNAANLPILDRSLGAVTSNFGIIFAGGLDVAFGEVALV